MSGWQNGSSGSQWYYTTTGGTVADNDVVWVKPYEPEHDHNKDGEIIWHNANDYKITYDTIDWDSDVYINGKPVNTRLERLEKMVMEMWEMFKPQTQWPGAAQRKIEKMIDEIKELKSDLKENDLIHKEEKEEQPLDDKLFEI